MRCYNCGRENPPKTIFCLGCASRLDITTFNQPSRGVYVAPQDQLAPRTQAKRQSVSALEIISWLLFVAAAIALLYHFWLRP